MLCGSAGSGKGTLTGRLPYESVMLFEGRLAVLTKSMPAVHEQIDAASLPFLTDLAVIVVDASKGMRPQDRQHCQLISLLGIGQIVLAVNKMDLVSYSESVFHSIFDEYRDFARQIGLEHITAIPLSALHGVNITGRGGPMPWYHGATLTGCLDTAEIDLLRGGAAAVDTPTSVADQFEATIIWMHDAPLLPGRRYLLRSGTQTVTATITDIKHQLSVGASALLAAKQLACHAAGVCNVSVDRPMAFKPYNENREMGGFILIDQVGNKAVGIGLVHFALRRAQNIHMQHVDVNKAARAMSKGQNPCVLWFTGLSGSGKSTIANLVEMKLHAMGGHTYLLDGDNVRHGLNKDLGFTEVDRVENIRRVAEVAKLMVDAGLIVLVAFISPFRSERLLARELLEDGEFVEIFVDTPLAVAEERDPKGLYRKARRGELKNFTGIDSPYEAPQTPEIHLDTTSMTPGQAAELVLATIALKTDR